MAIIPEYDDGTLSSTFASKEIKEEHDKIVDQIGELKLNYDSANALYRQTIVQNRQSNEKNSPTRPETIPFQTFNQDNVNFDKCCKGVREFEKDMKHDNARQNFLMGKLPSDIQTQWQNH